MTPCMILLVAKFTLSKSWGYWTNFFLFFFFLFFFFFFLISFFCFFVFLRIPENALANPRWTRSIDIRSSELVLRTKALWESKNDSRNARNPHNVRNIISSAGVELEDAINNFVIMKWSDGMGVFFSSLSDFFRSRRWWLSTWFQTQKQKPKMDQQILHPKNPSRSTHTRKRIQIQWMLLFLLGQ